MSRTTPFLIAGLIFVLDRGTKVLIERNVSMWDSHPVIPNIVNIVYTRNTGAAFGLFRDAPEMVRAVLLIGMAAAILCVLAWMLWKEATNPWPLALLLGGAAGNLYDRAVYGSVTDFIQVFIGSYEWPSFNVADSAITVGAILLALDMLKTRTPKHAPQTD